MSAPSSPLSVRRDLRRMPAGFECLAGCAVVLVCLTQISRGSAQDKEGQLPEHSPQADHTVWITTHGIIRYGSGRWGMLQIDAVNNSTTPGSIETAAWTEDEPDNQFGRVVWLPAESTRSTWQPILVPRQPVLLPWQRGQDNSPTLYWMGLRRTDREEVFAAASDRDRIESRPLILTEGQPVYTVISGNSVREQSLSDLLTYSLGQAGTGAALIPFNAGQLPVTSEALDVAQVLVVTGDRLADDAAAVEAVRDWVCDGGTLWLMLDTMSPDSPQTITGGNIPLHEVDRLSIASYSLSSRLNLLDPKPDRVELQRPVPLVRIIADGATVLCDVDEWPAAIAVPFGRGRIICSMLSLDGWTIPRDNVLTEEAESVNQRIWLTTASQNLFSVINNAGSELPLKPEAMTEYVTGRIGYQLPSRSSGAAVLILYSTTLIVVSAASRRSGRPMMLIPGIAVASGLATGSFYLMSEVSRTVDESVVTMQFVEAGATQDRVRTYGVSAIHSLQSSRPQIESTAAGMVRLDDQVGAGAPIRMLWTDQNSWQLKNVKLSPGVRLAEFRQSVNVNHPVSIKGTFDESGFQGQLAGDLSNRWSDAIIADQTSFALPVEIDPSGDVSMSSSGPMPPGEYLSAVLLNSEQARRQQVYRHMFETSGRDNIYPEQPTLFAWSDPLELQTGMKDGPPETGAMLLAVPVTIERPEAGSRVTIPSTFLPYRSVRIQGNRGSFASNYSNSRRTWSVSSSLNPSMSSMRFQIPPALLPLVVDSAMVKLKLSAPLRQVRISSGKPHALTDIWSKDGPVGSFEIPLATDSSRQLDDQGGLYVVIQVGSVQLDALKTADAGTQDRNWQIEWMQLEIRGHVQ